MSFGRRRASQAAWPIAVVVVAVSMLVAASPVAAVQPLAVYTGYMDTHTSSPTSNQPNPWPFTSPSNYVGTPCSGWPTSNTCWDAAAIRLDNPNSTPITGVHVIANIGGSIYDLWGSLTVPAGGILVLTETGSQNSTNFDGSDFPPNAYNSGNFADCTNNGVVPIVSVTVGGATTSYFDTTQVLDGGGHDAGHCVGSTYVSGRMDESHQWTLVSPPAQSAPTVTGLNPSGGAAAGGTQITITGSGFTGVSQVSFGATAAASFTFVSDSQVTAVAPAGSGKVDVRVTVGGTTSPVNQPADQYTYISPPGAPTGLSATAGNGSIRLAWTAPASNGGSAVTGYDVYRGNASGNEALLASGVSGPPFTDGGLVNGTQYFYKVSAVNSAGEGPVSNEASATPATVPGAPQNLVAVAGNASVSLSWTAPASNGGAAVTSYNVLRSTTSGAETLLSAGVVGTSFTDTGLSNGSTYFYKVAAVNSVGPGPVSGEASATPTAAPTVPSAPQNLVAVAGNASVALSWSAPASNGGAAVSSYNVWRSTSSGGEGLLSSGVVGTSFSDGSALNGITYFYKVAAVNSVGPGPLSNEASATPATVPSAPQNLTATGGNASVALSWSAPASNGGATVSSYNVLRSTTSGAETTLSTGVSGTSFSDTTVSNGSTYYYEVRAVNSAGQGAVSNEASATPAPTVPSAPQNLSAVAGNASVALSWTAPASNGGAAVSSYNVLRSTTSGTETTLSTGVSGTSYTDTTVSNGSTYFYKVTAVNSAGAGAASNEVSASPQVPASAAYIRRIASATAATGGTSITLTVGSPGVVAGHAIVVIALLSSTSSITGALSVSDTAGNLYSVGRDVNDGSAGDRLVVLVAVNVKALAATNQITLRVPSSGEIHAGADEYAGVTGIDTSAGATASSTSFSAGPVSTTQTPEILVGAVGVESGSTPVWAAGWSGLPALAISSDYLGSAYQIVSTSGPFTASGTTSGTWMTALVALKTH
jgi:fibronectin type 3 domain-containing protein